MAGSEIAITWLGHAATKIETDGNVIVIDPFLEQNPATPEDQKQPSQLDLMLITHGHYDHMGDAVSLVTRHQPDVIANFEICAYLQGKGAQKCNGMNTGGTVDWNGVKVTMTQAVHSSGISEGDSIIYGGIAGGFVLRFPNGFCLYHSGDTDVFSSMQLIGSRFHPDVALLPIGGHYTMDPNAAADAVRLLGVKNVIPIHYGTWPPLAGRPDALREAAKDVSGLNVIALEPGQTVTQSQIG
ncbi:MAG TPA: metal-dependent hydrolase [Chloroflexota bacterium]|nr:metal-dependent hydrolase [Chloroflexota bacterium]